MQQNSSASREEDLWFLPGPPLEDEVPYPSVRAPRHEVDLVDEWRQAEGVEAARLAQAALRLGALDERLRRGPPGWRRRLALQTAADFAWSAGYRIAVDRLGLWIALRQGNTAEEDAGMARAGWALRRLSGGEGPDADLAAFLGRREAGQGEAPLGDRIAGWQEMMARAQMLHPLTRAGFGLALWPLAGIGPAGDVLEAAVIAARIAASACPGGLVFAPLGTALMRQGGDARRRLAAWLDGIEAAAIAALRQTDRLEDWTRHAAAATAGLKGRTPARLIDALVDWPLLSAPMAEAATGASRAAVQRNLDALQELALIREVTGQGRFRFWTLSETATPAKAARPAGLNWLARRQRRAGHKDAEPFPWAEEGQD